MLAQWRPPIWRTMTIRLVGDSPLISHRWGRKALENIVCAYRPGGE